MSAHWEKRMARSSARRSAVRGVTIAVVGSLFASACGSSAVPLLNSATSGGTPSGGGSAPAAPPPQSANDRAADQMAAGSMKVVATLTGTGGRDAFARPSGVAVDEQDALYVARMGGKRVAKFDRNGQFVKQWRGEGESPIEAPIDLAVGPGGNVYVLDKARGLVHVFTPDGQQVGQYGSDGPGFYNPSGLAGGPQAYFVADTGTGRVVKYDAAGKKLAELGRGGAQPELKEPTGVLAESDGGALVVDGAQGQLFRYSSEGKLGGSTEIAPRGLARISRLPDRSLLISDPPKARLLRWSADGKLLARYGGPGAGDGPVRFPTGLATDRSGNVYVADTQNNRVIKLQLQ